MSSCSSYRIALTVCSKYSSISALIIEISSIINTFKLRHRFLTLHIRPKCSGISGMPILDAECMVVPPISSAAFQHMFILFSFIFITKHRDRNPIDSFLQHVMQRRKHFRTNPPRLKPILCICVLILQKLISQRGMCGSNSNLQSL